MILEVKLIKKSPASKKIGAHCELNDAASWSIWAMFKRVSLCFSCGLDLMYSLLAKAES